MTTQVISDCLADGLETFWSGQRDRCPQVDTWLLNLGNGPECHSRRTQFIARLVEFVKKTGLTVRLAYYPSDHSRYNPVERCWGTLDHHWNGSLLDAVEAVERFAASMTWKGKHPNVKRVTTLYKTGVKLAKEARRPRGKTSAPAWTGQMVCRHHARLRLLFLWLNSGKFLIGK